MAGGPKRGLTPRRIGILLIVAVVLALAVPTYNLIYDAAHPVTVRRAGELPNLAALIGRPERDAKRMLGRYDSGKVETHDPTKRQPTDRSRNVRSFLCVLKDVDAQHHDLVAWICAMPDGTIEQAGVHFDARDFAFAVDGNLPHKMLASVGAVADGAYYFNQFSSIRLDWCGRAHSSDSTPLEWSILGGMDSLSGQPISMGLTVGMDVIPSDKLDAVGGSDGGDSPPPIATGSSNNSGADQQTSTSEQPAQSETPPAPQPSSDYLDYAKQLGGKPHEGEALYFVIGDSLGSETAAAARLQKALPVFGDAQVYYIVQKSDNFQGMRPGYWVIIEAYRNKKNADDGAQWGKRCFSDCYVKQATVKTSDPIPVVEDLTPGM